MTRTIVVDTEQLDRDALDAVRAACQSAQADLVPLREVRGSAQPSALIIGSLRRGERRLPEVVVDFMTNTPDAPAILLTDDPLIRPSVATHDGRVTLLARPASSARIRGTIRMLLAGHRRSRAEHLGPQLWTSVVADSEATAPAIRRDDSSLTAVFPLDRGWSGADELCEEVDHIVQAHLDEDERLRSMRDLLGNAAGMIHLSPHCRQWVTYWPTSRSPLLVCSSVRLPRICNIADGVSKQIFTLNASPGDLVIAMGSEDSQAAVEKHVGDGGAAFVEHIERLGKAVWPALVVEVR